MSGSDKLNKLAGAYNKKDKEDFVRGATSSGSLVQPKSAAPLVDNVPMGEMQAIDDSVEAQQKANLANPSVQDKLNAVAKARAKFFGESK